MSTASPARYVSAVLSAATCASTAALEPAAAESIGDVASCGKCLTAGKKRGAPCCLTDVLHAGDDFLTGVAALIKAHAPDALEVHGLRDKFVACGRNNKGNARGRRCGPISLGAAREFRVGFNEREGAA